MTRTYEPLTAKAVKELIAPHSWIAAIAPVGIGAAFAFTVGACSCGYSHFNNTLALNIPESIWPWIMFALMLATVILLQSAVNTLNDYVDFKQGTDTEENCVDETDASIIYNNLNPKDALKVVYWCMGLAALFGLTIVSLTNWIPLVIGLVGASTVALYSVGPKPIAYLPLGEFVSGFVMGELITVATYYVMAGPEGLSWLWMFVMALPAFITISNIMQTNNTCDIERDLVAGRRTLPILIGATSSAHLMATLSAAVLVFTGMVGYWLHPLSLIVVAVIAALAAKKITKQWSMPYSATTRPQAFKNTIALAVILNGGYIATILIGANLG